MKRVGAAGAGRAAMLFFTLALLALALAGAASGSAVASTPGDPVVAAAGDIACDPTSPSYNGGLGTATECRHKYTSDLLVDHDLAAVLPLGDLQYNEASLSKFEQSYEPTWGRVKALTRPAVGNHEYKTAGAAGYFDYFNGIGTFAGPAGDRDKGYYSYEVGSWHLVALNSNCSQVGGCEEGSPQNEWLEADLAAHPGSCILAYTHHPRFSSGPHGPSAAIEPFWEDLYAAGADLFLSGHDHLYERFARQSPSGAADPVGIRQFVVGSGGKSHYAVVSTSPNSEATDPGHYGVLELTLAADGYEWRFVRDDGSVGDAGSDVCAPSVPDPAPDPGASDPGSSEPIASEPAPVEPPPPDPGPSDPTGGDGGGASDPVAALSPPADPPDTRIAAGPRGTIRERSLKFRFRSTADAASFRCKRKGPRRAGKRNLPRWRPCASPVTLRGLRPGRHVFKVRSIDAAGNEDPEPATRRFRIVR